LAPTVAQSLAPTSTPTVYHGNIHLDLFLVDTETNLDLQSLESGDTIFLDTAGTDLSIRVEPSHPIDSIEFLFDGNFVKNESTAPYAINGDNPVGNYKRYGKLSKVGPHNVTVIAFKGQVAVASTSTSFTVQEATVVPTTSASRTASPSSATSTAASTSVEPSSLPISVKPSVSPSSSSSASSSDAPTEGPSAMPSRLPSLILEPSSLHSSDEPSLLPSYKPSANLSPSSQPDARLNLILVDAKTEDDIGELKDRDIIDLSATGQALNVRAESDYVVDVMEFYFDGEFVRNETQVPYALGGDKNNGTDYKVFHPMAFPGNHSIEVRGFRGSMLVGDLSVSFAVVDAITFSPSQDPTTLSLTIPTMSSSPTSSTTN